uniref:Uncharacterized protein n=1 Tax=Strigamia maritima TaxID=126957 RepID=T1IUC9_STRMM
MRRRTGMEKGHGNRNGVYNSFLFNLILLSKCVKDLNREKFYEGGFRTRQAKRNKFLTMGLCLANEISCANRIMFSPILSSVNGITCDLSRAFDCHSFTNLLHSIRVCSLITKTGQNVIRTKVL